MTDGWIESAEAWIADVATNFGRQYILDTPMLARVQGRGFTRALDVGCGEGRFCRMLQTLGVQTVGIDPTAPLLDEARRLDPAGDYRPGRAEALDFPDGAFDLVVSYLTFIDIPEIERAIAEMARVLRPGGRLLVANLTSFVTAANPEGWRRDAAGELRFCIDNYLDPRVDWVSWRGIKIQNWHRPLSLYMSLLLNQGLTLRYFDEPAPNGGGAEAIAHARRVPWFMIMEWEKPT